MSINLGGNKNNIYIGLEEVDKIYVGAFLVYPDEIVPTLVYDSSNIATEFLSKDIATYDISNIAVSFTGQVLVPYVPSFNSPVTDSDIMIYDNSNISTEFI